MRKNKRRRRDCLLPGRGVLAARKAAAAHAAMSGVDRDVINALTLRPERARAYWRWTPGSQAAKLIVAMDRDFLGMSQEDALREFYGRIERWVDVFRVRQQTKRDGRHFRWTPILEIYKDGSEEYTNGGGRLWPLRPEQYRSWAQRITGDKNAYLGKPYEGMIGHTLVAVYVVRTSNRVFVAVDDKKTGRYHNGG